MSIRTEYRFIRMAKAEIYKGRRVWLIENRTSGAVLAQVGWYPPWRQFVMVPESAKVALSADCLRDIAEFVTALNRAAGEPAKEAP